MLALVHVADCWSHCYKGHGPHDDAELAVQVALADGIAPMSQGAHATLSSAGQEPHYSVILG